jgi:hypothetical protein
LLAALDNGTFKVAKPSQRNYEVTSDADIFALVKLRESVLLLDLQQHMKKKLSKDPKKLFQVWMI